MVPPMAKSYPYSSCEIVTRFAGRILLDWATLHARTWGVDVWRCPCGGKRKVTAIVTSRRVAEEILRNLGLLPPSSPRPDALPQAPPQLELPIE